MNDVLRRIWKQEVFGYSKSG